jgi:hypothetical protein
MYTQLVTGDVPGASTYFNPLLGQTIVPCTSGTRPSSPATGMHIFETDTGKTQRWDGAAWRPVASARISYTPVLTSTGTAPVLGTGSTAVGWYVYHSDSIVCNFFLKFGTSGASFGTGNWLVSLPQTATTVYGGSIHPAVGSTQLADNSAGTFSAGTCFVDASTGNNVGLISGSPVTSAVPWTWATSDYLSGQIIYPV